MERHVIWDWNGTLFDDRVATFAALNDVLSDNGLHPVTEHHYRTRFRRPIREYYEEVFGRPIGNDEWMALDAAFHDRYRMRLDTVGLAADATDALETVKAAGWTQSILSMWLHGDLVPLVQRLGIAGYFVRIVGTAPGDGDPKDAHLRRHLERVGPATSYLLVGDTVDDALAAQRAGIDYVLYAGGLHAPEVLADHGPTVTRLREAVDR